MNVIWGTYQSDLERKGAIAYLLFGLWMNIPDVGIAMHRENGNPDHTGRDEKWLLLSPDHSTNDLELFFFKG